jgi:nicotinamidase-related amidase
MKRSRSLWSILNVRGIVTVGFPMTFDGDNVMKTAFVIIDIQNDYFPGGRMELEGSIEAGRNAGIVLAHFRMQKLPVVHIQHVSLHPGARFFLPNSEGVAIHSGVEPLPGETVLKKNYPNAFRATPLLDILKQNQVGQIVVAGMMTHMCVDATVRAAFDSGFGCVVLGDACATRSLVFQEVNVPAQHVHAAFLAALGSVYAEIVTTANFLAAADQKNAS